MPFCSNCGAPLIEGAKFCSRCGAKLITPAAPQVTAAPQ
ncbi:MAG: zinc ribbon domain-containing protein, partial [Bacillota bacterium]|nr:zinc ribbon domain-containing protein [Bacillota bacterium]